MTNETVRNPEMDLRSKPDSTQHPAEEGPGFARKLQQQKLQMIGQLAAGVVHEINNPAGYILSNLTTLEGYFTDLARLLRAYRTCTTRDPSPELDRVRSEVNEDFLLKDFREALSDCKDGAQKIREIVRTMKDFSRPEEGETKPVDIEAVLDNALRVCWNEIKYKAALRRERAPLPPLTGCAQRLTQAFINLLVNAAQAIEHQGEIRISTSLEQGEIVIRVRDTGCGIPPEHRPRLFEPFFTTKPAGTGTGMGLYISNQIVRSHGGSIQVDSEPGRGTEFSVHLPLCPSILPEEKRVRNDEWRTVPSSGAPRTGQKTEPKSRHRNAGEGKTP